MLRASLHSHLAKLFCFGVDGAVLRRPSSGCGARSGGPAGRSLRSLRLRSRLALLGLLAYSADPSATKSSYAQCFGRESLLVGDRF